MEHKVIILNNKDFVQLKPKLIKSHYQRFGLLFSFHTELPMIEFNETKYRKINITDCISNYLGDNLLLDEGIIRTYPTKFTVRYVYNNMEDKYLNIFVPDEEQNDDNIANHILTQSLKSENVKENMEYQAKLDKLCAACGYYCAITKDENTVLGVTTLSQYEPMYQDTVNESLGKYLYHITTKDKCQKILQYGFTPKNACAIGLLTVH